MKCGVIYVKIVPNTKQLEWIKYCYLIDVLSEDMRLDIKEIVTYINDKYKDYMIIPMDYIVHPGCIVRSEFTDSISREIYERFDKMMKKYTDIPSIRCVWSVGEVDNPYSSNIIHKIYGPALTKVGHYLDLSYDAGLYSITEGNGRFSRYDI